MGAENKGTISAQEFGYITYEVGEHLDRLKGKPGAKWWYGKMGAPEGIKVAHVTFPHTEQNTPPRVYAVVGDPKHVEISKFSIIGNNSLGLKIGDNDFNLGNVLTGFIQTPNNAVLTLSGLKAKDAEPKHLNFGDRWLGLVYWPGRDVLRAVIDIDGSKSELARQTLIKTAYGIIGLG